MEHKFKCPVCFKRETTSVEMLSRHLRADHLIFRRTHLKCMEDGCHRTFNRSDNFLKHLKKFHPAPSVDSECDINELPETFEDNIVEETFSQLEDKDTSEKLLKKTLQEFVLGLRSKGGVNQSTVIDFVRFLNQLFADLSSYLVGYASLPEFGLLDAATFVITSGFERIKNLLNEFTSIHKQDAYFEKTLKIAKPIEYALGSRIDQRYNGAMGCYVNMNVTNSFQYIPIKGVIERLMELGNLGPYLTNIQTSDGLIKSYNDGQQFEAHPLFSTCPNALQIQLYYDEVELVNPLGSKTKCHELGEEVDGTTLKELSDEEMKTVGFSTLGMRKSLKRLLKSEVLISSADDSFSLPSSKPCSSDHEAQKFDNIRSIVKSQPGGEQILDQLETDGFFQINNQRKFIKICIDIILARQTNLAGFKPQYPPTKMKIQLAEAIIKTFPVLKYVRPGTHGYEHFYDAQSRSGYIESRLKTLRRKLPFSEKAYKKSGKRKHVIENLESDEESSSTVDIRDTEEQLPSQWKIAWLKDAVPDRDNCTMIRQYMQETFAYRRQEIDKDKPSLTSILLRYPRFLDFEKGILIEEDFKRMFPMSEDSSLFLPVAPKLVEISAKRLKYYAPLHADVNLQALLVLQKLLPPINTVRSGEAGEVIVFEGAGTDPVNYAQKRSKLLTQPFLLAIGDRDNPTQFYLILDEIALAVGNDVFLAFFKLFYSFWVFNIHYYPKLVSFFNFFEAICLHKRPHCSVRTLLAALQVGLVDSM